MAGYRKARFERVRVHGGALISNLKTIEASVAERFSLGKRSEALRTELAELQSVLAVTLVPAIDDQLFYAMTGSRPEAFSQVWMQSFPICCLPVVVGGQRS